MFVGITNPVLDGMKRNIRIMMQAEMESAPAPKDLVFHGTESWIPTMIWGEHLELRKKLPLEWKSNMRGCYKDVKYKDQDFRLNIAFSRNVDGPPHSGYGYGAPGPIDVSVVQEHLEAQLARKEIKEKWEKVQTDLEVFLSKCKSLNEALKLWPQIETYMPKEYVAKVHEKREKREKEESNAVEALKSLDTEGLTAAAVVARIHGAKV
jgi:hypothetical protein